MKRTNTQEELKTFRTGVDRDTRRPRRILAGVAVMVAAAAVIAAVVAGRYLASDQPGTTGPAQAPAAVDVATAFTGAWNSYDRGEIATYLATDSALDLYEHNWRRVNRWHEAVGYKVLLDSCTEDATTSAGTTLTCTYDYNSLHSEDLGRGPYSGNTCYFTILNGKIVSAEDEFEYTTNHYSAQMWEPFAAWVARTHPKAVPVMYSSPAQDGYRLTDESIALWKKHSLEYVDAKS